MNKNPCDLNIEDCITFLKSCFQNNENSQIEKVGFTGGEPFLNLDFICRIAEFAVSKDLLFDRVMTNGVWWKTESDLAENLQKLYNSGFDGKICLSFDSFHNQNSKKIKEFIKSVIKIFGNSSVEIQTVIPFEQKNLKILKTSEFELLKNLSSMLNCEISITSEKKGSGFLILSNVEENFEIPVFIFSETLTSKDKNSFKSKKWFKEDFCQGPGNILYIHSDGNIAPCCGFSNENSKLFIGKITDSFEKVLENAKNNKMIKLCFEDGLSSEIKNLKKQKKLTGKTDDICTFCDLICNLK